MRVTNTQYTQNFTAQLQGLLSQQTDLQKQAATGLKFTQASEDPAGYQSTQIIQTRYAANSAYLNTITDVQSLAEYNHQAMSDLQTALSKAGEVATGVSGTDSASDLAAKAAVIDGVLAQVAAIANRQKDNNYLFGGTSNVQPITITAGPPTTYAYTSGTNSTTTSAQISSAGTSVTTGLVAGSATATTPYSGFLYNTTTGTDTIDVLTQLRDALNAPTAGTQTVAQAVATVQGLLTQVNATIDTASEYVGKTAANLQVLDMNSNTLKNSIQSDKTNLSSVTSASLADVVASLQQVETNYSAALQSGAKILQLSLMDYIS